MLWVALISICLVFLVLVLLVWVMKLFGYVFTRRQAAATAAANKSAVELQGRGDGRDLLVVDLPRNYRGLIGSGSRSGPEALPERPARQGVRSADHPEHQACLFALEFENSRFNPASRKEIELK